MPDAEPAARRKRGWIIAILSRPPQLLPTLFALPAFAVLLGLGSWQVQRALWKSDLNAHRAARAAAPAVDLPPELSDPAEYEFRRVRVQGRFLHDKELLINARSQRGNAGYNVITPMIRPSGAPVLINRGWIPYDKKAAASRAAGQVEGAASVEGILRRDQRQGMFMPPNDAAKNSWFWYDLPAMAKAAGVADALPIYVEAGPTPNPGGFPIGGQTRVKLPENHLEYAFTWYALAVALAAVYILFHRQRRA